QRGDGLRLFGGEWRFPARGRASFCLVRRAGEMEGRAGGVGQSAPEPARRRKAAGGGDDHAETAAAAARDPGDGRGGADRRRDPKPCPGDMATCSSLPIKGREAFQRIVIGVDPPATAAGDACGIVVCGLDAVGRGYVLADHSAAGLSPEQWARKVAGAAEAWAADRVVAEGNQGGEMVTSVLK